MNAVNYAKDTKRIIPKKLPGRRLIKEYVKYRYMVLMLLPALAYFILFRYGPMVGIIIAFKDYNFIKGIFGSPWVGLKNFEDVFTGLYFFKALRNTLIISFYKLIFGFPAPILLCLFLNEVRHAVFKKVVQSITYLPYFISWVVLAGLVIEMLSPSRGPVNILLQSFGVDPVFFVADERWFRPVLVSSGIWREVGWGSIIYLAAVTGVDPELYDVAEIDGAGRFRKIWNVTLPSIAPVILIMFIFATGNIINDDFDQVYNLLNSKVLSVGDVISTYTYSEGLVNMNYSFATAVGLFKSVVAFTLVMITNYFSRKASEYSII